MTFLINPFRFGGGGGAFSPTDIAGLRTWLKADALSLNNGDEVTTWTDSSGSGNNATQSTEATRKPNYFTNVQNSLPIVRFDVDGSAEDRMVWPTTLMSGATAGSVFITLSLPLAASGRQSPVTMTSNGEFTHYTFSDGNWYDNWGSTTRKTISGSVTLTTFHLFEIISAPSDWRAYQNGTQKHSTATNTVGFGSSAGLGSTNLAFGADIGEVLVYDTALSTTDRQNVETYLKDKWGIA